MKKSKIRSLLAELIGWILTDTTYYDEIGIPLGVCETVEWKPDKDAEQAMQCLDKWRRIKHDYAWVSLESVTEEGKDLWLCETGFIAHRAKSPTKAIAVGLAKSWRMLKKEKNDK